MVDKSGQDRSGSKGDELLPENSDNRTARTECAHPISLMVADNGADGRGPELRIALQIMTLLDHNWISHYVHPADMSSFDRTEEVNTALHQRRLFSALGRGRKQCASKYLR
jgi:hypothetical protein